MFLQASVILLTGGVCLSACWDTTPQGGRPPRKEAPPGIPSMSGRYASYWNAFLFTFIHLGPYNYIAYSPYTSIGKRVVRLRLEGFLVFFWKLKPLLTLGKRYRGQGATPAEQIYVVKEECIPVGCCHPLLYGECLPREVSAQWVYTPIDPEAYTPRLWTEWLIDRCKTLPCHNYVADGKKMATNGCRVDFMLLSGARFIRTVCMRRIRWSCEGLTSVHNEYTGYLLKHLLLRHMYNLPLPILLCCAQALHSETSYCYRYCWSTDLSVCVCDTESLCLCVSHCTVRCFIYCLCRR